VLACGGGVVTQETSRALLRGGAFVVWLRVSPGIAAARLGARGVAERPLLQGEGPVVERIEALLGRRALQYQAAAHVAVETDGRDPEAVAAEVERAWEAWAKPWDLSGS